jgi:hypothetical protein
MRKEQLDNLTKGSRPTLHALAPNWDTLRGLVERATDSLSDAKQKANSCTPGTAGRPPLFGAAAPISEQIVPRSIPA